jgi:hypothetical protein
MFGDTIGITYNAVAKTLNKVNQDNYGAEYYLEETGIRYRASVQHTIPKAGQPGESHMFRLDVEHYDGNNVLLRTASSWTVIRTSDAVQDSTSSTRGANALIAFLTPANVTKLTNRES